MYVGHAGIALALKTGDPRVHLAPLVLACYGPDWIEFALMFPHTREGMAPYTHSIQAVIIGAVLAAALYAAITRRPGAMPILIGWLLHWPADFFTGHKPLTGLDDMIGLDLYHLPMADFALECAIVLAACMFYVWRFDMIGAQRRTMVYLALLLFALQGICSVTLSNLDDTPWTPLLAPRDERPHLSNGTSPRDAHLLHFASGPTTAR
ncbi:MAG: hypothetical protein H0W68_13075 [Gemmatimonadaceae bacterium]|nr:hypothetical protein [Gemmatimonadaceae bacterium]